jgi:hypothetical protein
VAWAAFIASWFLPVVANVPAVGDAGDVTFATVLQLVA